MLKMNETHLALPYHPTVITFSHCLPRQDLPFWNFGGDHAKTVGCLEIEGQLRSVKSKLHVYGRSHRRYIRDHEGVKYVNLPIGTEDERLEDTPPLCIVYDGRSTTGDEWAIDDTRIMEQTHERLEREKAGRGVSR